MAGLVDDRQNHDRKHAAVDDLLLDEPAVGEVEVDAGRLLLDLQKYGDEHILGESCTRKSWYRKTAVSGHLHQLWVPQTSDF